MFLKPGLSWQTSEVVKRTIENERKQGALILEIAGTQVADKDSFFALAKQTFPLEPPLRSTSWDALADSLWEGIDESKGKRVLIVWKAPEVLKNKDPESFKIALEIFSDLYETTQEKELFIILEKEMRQSQ